MDGRTWEVTVVQGGRQSRLHLRPGENLLLALVAASYPVPFSCTTGKCATCRLIVWKPDGSLTAPGETEAYRLGPEAVGQGFRLACQVFVNEPLLVAIPDEGGS
jgi:ferredoxin